MNFYWFIIMQFWYNKTCFDKKVKIISFMAINIYL